MNCHVQSCQTIKMIYCSVSGLSFGHLRFRLVMPGVHSMISDSAVTPSACNLFPLQHMQSNYQYLGMGLNWLQVA